MKYFLGFLFVYFLGSHVVCSEMVFAEPANQTNPAPNEAAIPFQPPTLRGEKINPKLSIASYAQGTVRFAYPNRWSSFELPMGREVRLVFALDPKASDASLQNMLHGFWLNYRYLGEVANDPEAELKATMQARCQVLFGKSVRYHSQGFETIDGKPSMKQAFSFEVAQSDQREKPKSYLGEHVLVRTEKGLFELHYVAPREAYEPLRLEILELLSTLELGNPTPEKVPTDSPWSDAAGAIGTWKSIRGRIIFTSEGNVVLRFDNKRGYPISSSGRLNYKTPMHELQGTYEANGDLLLVTWEDGSKLNLRWRAENGSLFLTDHLGRTTQLNRIFPE